MQLSTVPFSAFLINRLPHESYLDCQDAYYTIMLLSGEYLLEQDGREVFLQPSDMTIYDATRLHRVHCPSYIEMLIFSIPRPMMKGWITAIESCTAIRVTGTEGVGSIASNFLCSAAA